MLYRGLLRYKGVVIATAVLLVIILLYALVSASIGGREAKFGQSVRSFADFQYQLGAPEVALTDAQASASLKQLRAQDEAGLETIFANELQQLQTFLSKGERAKAAGLAAEINLKANKELARKSNLSNYIHWAVIIISGLVYLLAVLPQIAKLTQEETVEVESRKEAQNILGTVSEGLFLLGRDHEIGVEQSASLKELFRSERDLEGNFFDFIGQYVPEGTVTIARDYLDLLYGDRVKEKLVKDLNPLNEVEIHIARRDGSYESRFLNFSFSRVLEDGELSHLLGSVNDVTREVTLARQLEETKEEQEAQMDLLMRVLHLDQASLLRFFEQSDETLREINTTLEERGHTNDEIRQKIKVISERAHRVKGDAAALGLHGFEFNIHALETELDKVQSTTDKLTGRDLLPAVTCLKTAFSELDNMRKIVTRFSEAILAENKIGGDPEPGDAASSSAPATNVVSAAAKYSAVEGPLYSLVDELSDRRGVRVLLKTFGLGDDEVPADLQDIVRSSAVQLIRNSIVHGGLAPQERLEQSKTDYLTIVVSLTETERGHSLLVRDDGEGLNEEKILTRAVDLGLIPSLAAAEKDERLAQKLIFHSGFSSQAEADLDAGRGVGLNTVYEMVRSAGGSIGLRHSQGRYCQFYLNFNS